MDATAILARSRRLQANAGAVCALAEELRAQAWTDRDILRQQVQRRAGRRIARLARGGSSASELPKWNGDGLKETWERACPHCGDRTIAPGGHVRAVDGVVKAMYLCEDCKKVFVLVLTLLR